ncbi:transmembrane proteins 14C-domain-containing protein [Polychytrium aggregatum]|uniref:transmembrane proteins 14C-domain-containing protein n=1 Tax=Polychytrium aggregatum TaxID=110093 RepID=UPI0022FF2812|nr:transmembrane proteins 14C-domain-containing protein [Polychytrium aggregatum]KAI9197457.1 transmembrane proteins 14C-domain-containing protein [Polychytrium aggregatum]
MLALDRPVADLPHHRPLCRLSPKHPTTMSHHPAYTLSGLCAVGGVVGYARTRSKPSLIAGLAFAALFGASGYLIQSNQDWGVELASASSAILTSAMLPRAIKTRKPVPAGLALVGVAGLGYYGKKLYEQTYGL